MRPSTRRIARSVPARLPALACCVVIAAGCADAGDEIGEGSLLAAAEVEELTEAYPVLDEERAPEPEPAPDATPADVPEPVEEALPDPVLETVTGEATFYADLFEGRTTASGVPFRQNQMVAAHRAYPFGTVLRVTNLRNDRSVDVRVVDRGPFGGHAKARGTILDLSRRAARELDFIRAGRTPIRVEVLEWGEGLRAG